MAEKSAEIHTIAPRLSYVEDKLDWVVENSGSGGGGVDQKLWRATLEGAEASATWGSEPWAADDLIYGPESPNLLSLHQTIFGMNSTGAIGCQDGKGFFGRIFREDDSTWSYDSVGTAAMSDYIFGSPSSGLSAAELLDKSATLADEVLAKLEEFVEQIQQLRDDMEFEINRIENVVIPFLKDHWITPQLDDIRARLSAGGL